MWLYMVLVVLFVLERAVGVETMAARFRFGQSELGSQEGHQVHKKEKDYTMKNH